MALHVYNSVEISISMNKLRCLPRRDSRDISHDSDRSGDRTGEAGSLHYLIVVPDLQALYDVYVHTSSSKDVLYIESWCYPTQSSFAGSLGLRFHRRSAIEQPLLPLRSSCVENRSDITRELIEGDEEAENSRRIKNIIVVTIRYFDCQSADGHPERTQEQAMMLVGSREANCTI